MLCQSVAFAQPADLHPRKKFLPHAEVVTLQIEFANNLQLGVFLKEGCEKLRYLPL
jgi:hypothetical protein